MPEIIPEEIRVPMAIWEHKSLKLDDKCLWLLIHTRRDETGYCTLSNQELADLFGWTINFLNRRLKTLKNKRCLTTVWFDGKVRQLDALVPKGEIL